MSWVYLYTHYMPWVFYTPFLLSLKNLQNILSSDPHPRFLCRISKFLTIWLNSSRTILQIVSFSSFSVSNSSIDILITSCIFSSSFPDFQEVLSLVQGWSLYIVTDFVSNENPLFQYFSYCRHNCARNKIKILKSIVTKVVWIEWPLTITR